MRLPHRLLALSLPLVLASGGCGPRTSPDETPPRAAASARLDGDWPAYGRDAGGGRFSPLTQIDTATVGALAVAWTYRTGEMRPEYATRRPTSLEATPIVVDGGMYLSTPIGRVIALDPETGRERWTYDPGIDRELGFGDFTSRGVSTWLDSAAAAGAPCRRRIIVATIDARLIALDARDGAPCAGFGSSGIVDLRAGLRNAPFETEEYEVTSPPAVVGDLLVVGSAVADNNRTDAASGEVRAYDARTGALRWTWDPVPQDPADPAWSSWRGSRAHATGAANAWSVLAADPARDLVFVPTGSPSPDYFGGARLGDNRYANSVVALRASTGRVVWHFQVVHHDLWDYDVASPPALVTLRRDGRDVPAVLQATKTGQLFVLHRETGEPIFPVEERPVPRSTVPGEEASPTQPFTVGIPPLSPHLLRADDAWGQTSEDREACRSRMAALRNEGIFTPPSLEGTLVVPSSIGGAHWGGVAHDPARRIAVVPVNTVAVVVRLIPRERVGAVRNDEQGRPRLEPGVQYTDMRGTPYVMRREILRGPGGAPCSPPPFGELVAVDLGTGAIRWRTPLGNPGGLLKDYGTGVQPLGSPNLGGPIVTAAGLTFIAATLDRRLRAFATATGRELWSAELPAGGKATPMTYLGRDGRQYLVIAAGGDGGLFGRGDHIVAFALPTDRLID